MSWRRERLEPGEPLSHGLAYRRRGGALEVDVTQAREVVVVEAKQDKPFPEGGNGRT